MAIIRALRVGPKGDKGDKGEPGVDTALISANNAADSANTALLNANIALDSRLDAQVYAANAYQSASAAYTSENAASISETNALVSETNAFNYLRAYRSTSYGALDSNPTVDPYGAAPTVGDEYYNTNTDLIMRFSGTTWNASDINTFNLGSPDGVELVGNAVDARVLANTDGGKLIGFKSVGVGAASTTVDGVLSNLVYPEMFGAIGDGLTHPLSTRYSTLSLAQFDYPFATSLTQEIDYCALMAAIASKTFGTGWYVSGPEIRLRDGAVYYCGSNTLQIKKSVKISGTGSGLQSTSCAALKFAPNTRGIVIHRYNTIGDIIETTPTTAGDGSVLEGFQVLGGGGIGYTNHGIHLRARAVLRNMTVAGFSGNGINVYAASNGGPDFMGNANNFRIDTCAVIRNSGHGLYVQGYDANSGAITAVDSSGNGKSGIYDNSFLGNTYTACHTAGNGFKCQVHYNGSRYYCTSDTLGGSTTPGDDSVWIFSSFGPIHSLFPDWVSGEDYFIGYNYRAVGLNARGNVFIGNYSESSQPPSQILHPAIVVDGGMYSSGFTPNSTGQILSSRSSSPITVKSDAVAVTVGGLSTSGGIFAWVINSGVPYRFQYYSGNFQFDYANSISSAYITAEDTSSTFGRISAVPHIWSFPNSIGLGNGGTSRLFGRATYTTGTAMPTSGEYARGEIRLWANPSTSGKIGFVCTTGGIAGSTAIFKEFGAIDA